jgi:vacuolar protein sorting-associated protein 13A/C
VEGLEQEGIAGFARGAFKGVGGFFLKPMAGFFDFAKSAADGVVSSTKDAALDSNQIRLPRMLYSHDRVIRVVNPEHSLLRWYLSQLESMPPNFSYSAHVYDSQNGLLIALSSEHLVAADTKNQRLCLLVPLWRVLGVTTDLDHLVLSVNVQVPPQDVSSPSSAQGTSRVDFELSSVAVVKSVQQVVAKAMEW